MRAWVMPPLPRSKTAAHPPTSPGESARATRNLLFAVPGEHFQLVPSGSALLCVTRA
jgi:hypothetical protein